MGLEVAEISELAALRPIQTVAVRGARATEGGGDDHDAAAAADSGCVTPTASSAQAATANGDSGRRRRSCHRRHWLRHAPTPTASGPMVAAQPDGGADDASYATPTTSRTAAPQDGATADDAACFITPTSEDSALRPATVCPPAPRKLPPALKRKLAPLQQRLFFPVPRDLATVFMPAPPLAAAAKKMRAHAVESSLPLGT